MPKIANPAKSSSARARRQPQPELSSDSSGVLSASRHASQPTTHRIATTTTMAPPISASLPVAAEGLLIPGRVPIRDVGQRKLAAGEHKRHHHRGKPPDV